MTDLCFYWSDGGSWNNFVSAVSLHGHTWFSQENLGFAAAYLRRVPALRAILDRFDESDLWWHPPLPPAEAFRLEIEQIRRTLNLAPLVSLTDHDEIAACRTIQLLHGADATPLSIEWTAPTQPSFVHLGVHNLPASGAEAMFRAMKAYTAAPCERGLAELLEWLNEDPGTLVVLNHPLWDEARIGATAHEAMVRALLLRYRGLIHAVELNGLRPWRENAVVLALSREVGLPAVSGGDRHGTEPSACLNLTHAASFGAFVEEVRQDKLSTVLFMSQYAGSHGLRQFEAAWDVLRDYPDYPDRVRWTDRAFVRDRHGVARSLSALWAGGEPLIARGLYQAFRLFSHERIRPALRLAMAGRPHEPAM